MKPSDFLLTIVNNSAARIPVQLFNPQNGTPNARTNYSWDLSAAIFTGITSFTVVINSVTMTVPLLSQSVSGLVAALNSLNVGSFWNIGGIIYTANDQIVLGNLNVGTAVLTFTITFNSTATITHSVVLSGIGPFTGTVAWGDGTTDVINSLPATFNHNYSVAGTYTATFYIDTPAGVTGLQSTNSEISAIANLANLPSLTSLILSNNQLTTIDVSGNTSLTNLQLSNNQFATVNISTLIALVTLNLSFNQLTAISISNNTLLISCLVNNNSSSIGIIGVNNILINLDTFGLLNGTVNTSLQTPIAPPFGPGAAAKANLILKGWTVTT